MSTIKDVAKLAGVAVSTVSKVLNDYENVSDETKIKVREAVKQLDYIPNATAASLSKKQFTNIGLIVNINNKKQSIDEINMQYLFGAITKANEYKFNTVTIIASSLEGLDADGIERYLRSLSINSVVYFGLNKNNVEFHKLIDKNIFKTVVIDAPNVGKNTTSVTLDNYTAQYEVAKTLCLEYEKENEKAKNMLYIAGKKNGYITDVRLRGIEKFIKEFNIKIDVIHGDFSEKCAFDIIQNYDKEYDVVCCASDMMAIGCYRALKEMGVSKPVSGFDGITLLGYVAPDVITVKQDIFNIATVAIDEIKKLVEGEVGHSLLLDYEVTCITYEQVKS